MKKLTERLAQRLELPGELLAGVMRLTLIGGERVLIENHKGLLDYTDECVEVSGGKMRLRVRGNGLLLRSMSSEEVLVTGRVFAVEVDGA